MKIAIEAQRIFRTNKHGMDSGCSRNDSRTAKNRSPTHEDVHTGCPGRGSLPGRISQLPYRRNKMPDLSAMGTSSLTTSHSPHKTGYRALHE